MCYASRRDHHPDNVRLLTKALAAKHLTAIRFGPARFTLVSFTGSQEQWVFRPPLASLSHAVLYK
jgi:hypothetical protein